MIWLALGFAVAVAVGASSPRALGALEMERGPDVRCVVAYCFRPPRTREEMREQQRFERRLLSPRGKGRTE